MNKKAGLIKNTKDQHRKFKTLMEAYERASKTPRDYDLEEFKKDLQEEANKLMWFLVILGNVEMGKDRPGVDLLHFSVSLGGDLIWTK